MMYRLSGWRLALALLLGALFALLVLGAIVWLAALLAVVVAVAWLNVVLLPRIARRLRIPRVVADLACLVLLAGVGWLLAGSTGLAVGVIGWALGVGVPRLIGWRYRDRIQVATTQANTGEVLELEPGPSTDRPDVWRWERRP